MTKMWRINDRKCGELMIENVANLVLLSPPGVSYGVGDTPGVSYRVSHTGCVCLYGAKSHSWKLLRISWIWGAGKGE